jgi:uncharacterized protein
MTVAVTCTALLALLVFALGMNVSRVRGTVTDQFPTEPTDVLLVAVRAHGNATEYVPTLAVLILLVGARDPAAWMVATFVAAAVARYVHAVGIFTAGDLARQTPLRVAGAMGTYLCGVLLVAAALWQTFR